MSPALTSKPGSAAKHGQEAYYRENATDGNVVEVRPDGCERAFPGTPMRPMTEAEIEAAAAADPKARPMTPEELRSARRVPRVKTLRRALRLTQEEFSARYHIPLGTLRTGNSVAVSRISLRGRI